MENYIRGINTNNKFSVLEYIIIVMELSVLELLYILHSITTWITNNSIGITSKDI